ncbi:MAG: hypothetical protein V1722_02955 [Candidatus Micrarchaeota archaeon]
MPTSTIATPEQVKEKQAQFHYLLTQEASQRIIARENGAVIEKPAKPLTSLENLKQGDRVTNYFKIHYFNELKKFTFNERQGELLVLNLASQNKNAALTLWNYDGRKILESNLQVNDAVLLKDAMVKNVNPLELNADLLTAIEPVTTPTVENLADISKIPNREVNQTPLAQLAIDAKVGEKIISTTAMIVNLGELKTFQKEKGTGKLRRLALADGSKKINLVCWGEFAELASNFNRTDELKMTDVKVKANTYGDMELHTSRTTRFTKITGKAQIVEVEKPIAQLKENETIAINGRIEELKLCRFALQCEKCFAISKTQTCNCGGNALETLICDAVISDASGKIQCTFYDGRALQLLEMKSIAPDLLETLFELKKQQLQGKPVKILISTKFNNYLNQLSATAKQILT